MLAQPFLVIDVYIQCYSNDKKCTNKVCSTVDSAVLTYKEIHKKLLVQMLHRGTLLDENQLG